jgi:hypothetical protein
LRFIAGITLSLAFAMLAPAQTLSDAGSLAHFQSGGGWRTTFYLFNTGDVTSPVQLNFFGDDGQPVTIPLRLPQVAPGVGFSSAQFAYTLLSGSVLAVESDWDDPTGIGIKGWAKLQAGSNVTGYLIFRYAGLDGESVQEGVVTAETRNGKSYVLGFDNTGQHLSTFAIANVTNQSVEVTITARDAEKGGILVSTNKTLPAMGHWAANLGDFLPYTKLVDGTVEFSTPTAGQISVIGLRVTLPSFAITSAPPIMKQ